MPPSTNHFLLFASVLFGFATTVCGQTPIEPFELSWTAGSCHNCELKRDIEKVQFTSARDLWAVGYSTPGGQGAGDYSVIHSSDSGRHWTELATTRAHAVQPSLSFPDSKTGWISGMWPSAYFWVRRTVDAGSHWTKISDDYLYDLQFFDPMTGVGGKSDIYEGSRFAKTTDGGRTWTNQKLVGVKFISKVLFISPEIGWIAGTNDLSNDLNGRVAVVLRTTDGGCHWASVEVPTQVGVAEVQDLYFQSKSTGWLITWHYNNDGTHLYRTTDGGKSWTVHPDATIQGMGKWLSLVRFVSPQIGFAFARDDNVEATNVPGALGVVELAEGGPTQTGKLLYTDDGGEHWKSKHLAAWVSDCQVLGQALGCSAIKDNTYFLTLRITLRRSVGVSQLR